MSGPSEPGQIEHWMTLARQDLMAAKALLANVAIEPRLSVGLAAQAAEKALKAAMTSAGLEPPRSHDLVALAHRSVNLVRLTVPEDDLRRLSDAHEHARYPESDEDFYDPAEASNLVRVADTVVVEVTAALKNP